MDINKGLLVSDDRIQKFFYLKELKVKMSSVMLFSFNAVELCVVTINEKPGARARDVCEALEYGEATKDADVVRHLCSKTDYTNKWQLTGLVPETKPGDWPKDSQKYDIYIIEGWMYEILFSSQQPNSKDFKRHCWNVLFPHVRQQLKNKMTEDHQQAIEVKDVAIKLLNDDLKNRDHDNVSLQTQRDVYNDQLKKCQNIITHLRTHHVPNAKDPGKDNIVIIIEKNTTPEEDEFYKYPYYTARIQRRFISTKNDGLKQNTLIIDL